MSCDFFLTQAPPHAWLNLQWVRAITLMNSKRCEAGADYPQEYEPALSRLSALGVSRRLARKSDVLSPLPNALFTTLGELKSEVDEKLGRRCQLDVFAEPIAYAVLGPDIARILGFYFYLL